MMKQWKLMTFAAALMFAAPANMSLAQGERVALQLFSNVPIVDSENFAANTDARFQMQTTHWDRVPYHVAPSFEGAVTVPRGYHVYLAGNAQGDASYSIDNFLILEIGSNDPIAIGGMEPVSMAGRTVETLSDGAYSYAPDAFDLTSYFQIDVVTPVRVHALDYGGIGGVSDLFLIIDACPLHHSPAGGTSPPSCPDTDDPLH